MPYLNKDALVALQHYKYQSGLYGFLDRVIMTPFWNKCVTFLPLWIAPNLVTLLALFHVIVAFATLVHLCPGLTGVLPGWACWMTAYCLFVYQTLDAIDGKQARRTHSSSPLGQLFDHGCDALAACLSAVMVSIFMQSGPTWMVMAVLYLHIVPFFFSNWEESHTGVMRFGVLGVTEGQFLIISFFVCGGLFGPAVFQAVISIPVVGITIELRRIIIALAGVGVVWQIVESALMVADHFSKNVDTSAKKSEAWWQMAQYLVFLFLSYLWSAAPTGVFRQQSIVILATISLLFCYQVSRLIIHHVAGMPSPRVFPLLLPLPLVVGNSYSALMRTSGEPLLDEYLIVLCYFVVTLATYLHYVSGVIQEICAFLGIRAFTIVPAAKVD